MWDLKLLIYLLKVILFLSSTRTEPVVIILVRSCTVMWFGSHIVTVLVDDII